MRQRNKIKLREQNEKQQAEKKAGEERVRALQEKRAAHFADFGEDGPAGGQSVYFNMPVFADQKDYESLDKVWLPFKGTIQAAEDRTAVKNGDRYQIKVEALVLDGQEIPYDSELTKEYYGVKTEITDELIEDMYPSFDKLVAEHPDMAGKALDQKVTQFSSEQQVILNGLLLKAQVESLETTDSLFIN